MTPLDPEVLELERCALRAWPPSECVEVDGWRLRTMAGVTRRANSAWTAETRSVLSLAERIERVEVFYRARQLPSRVQVIKRSDPDPLDETLAKRGYVIDAPVSIQTAAVATVLAKQGPANLPSVVTREPTADWLHIAVDRGRFASAPQPFLGLLERLGTRARFATVYIAQAPISIALGVLDGRRIGLFNMATLPEYRRRGAARAALGALLEAARERGARVAYLQVERDNAQALELYRSAGFEERYRYHYRTAP